MTGPFGRLRAWVGTLFGSDTTEADDGDGPASTQRVVHRDDRPLETPSTMDRPDPPTPGAEDERVDSPEAAGDESDDAGETPVSIPDAESHDSTDQRAASTSTAPDTTTDDRDESTAAFTCSVCGTAVDDPSEPCPLCRSTDVVPASERDDDSAAPTRNGRTSVSTTDDDEAVDRLRDVSDEG